MDLRSGGRRHRGHKIRKSAPLSRRSTPSPTGKHPGHSYHVKKSLLRLVLRRTVFKINQNTKSNAPRLRKGIAYHLSPIVSAPPEIEADLAWLPQIQMDLGADLTEPRLAEMRGPRKDGNVNSDLPRLWS